jgi:hypothetical protein
MQIINMRYDCTASPSQGRSDARRRSLTTTPHHYSTNPTTRLTLEKVEK